MIKNILIIFLLVLNYSLVAMKSTECESASPQSYRRLYAELEMPYSLGYTSPETLVCPLRPSSNKPLFTMTKEQFELKRKHFNDFFGEIKGSKDLFADALDSFRTTLIQEFTGSIGALCKALEENARKENREIGICLDRCERAANTARSGNPGALPKDQLQKYYNDWEDKTKRLKAQIKKTLIAEFSQQIFQLVLCEKTLQQIMQMRMQPFLNWADQKTEQDAILQELNTTLDTMDIESSSDEEKI